MRLFGFDKYIWALFGVAFGLVLLLSACEKKDEQSEASSPILGVLSNKDETQVPLKVPVEPERDYSGDETD